ncbi:transcriptional coactivator ADA2, putative [Plasmodium chabaudi chabaudi]|uniref:Transcriptional coactivator ADA2, putative n=1 Tax=Plasmodium chabaudi chabaudi TaxID=31271 RepID=A0A1D3S088_PLACU|nr:transcriptional coactivator ADA2, putative [Plasmodium chabaudi chabaudi]
MNNVYKYDELYSCALKPYENNAISNSYINNAEQLIKFYEYLLALHIIQVLLIKHGEALSKEKLKDNHNNLYKFVNDQNKNNVNTIQINNHNSDNKYDEINLITNNDSNTINNSPKCVNGATDRCIMSSGCYSSRNENKLIKLDSVNHDISFYNNQIINKEISNFSNEGRVKLSYDQDIDNNFVLNYKKNTICNYVSSKNCEKNALAILDGSKEKTNFSDRTHNGLLVKKDGKTNEKKQKVIVHNNFPLFINQIKSIVTFNNLQKNIFLYNILNNFKEVVYINKMIKCQEPYYILNKNIELIIILDEIKKFRMFKCIFEINKISNKFIFHLIYQDKNIYRFINYFLCKKYVRLIKNGTINISSNTKSDSIKYNLVEIFHKIFGKLIHNMKKKSYTTTNLIELVKEEIIKMENSCISLSCPHKINDKIISILFRNIFKLVKRYIGVKNKFPFPPKNNIRHVKYIYKFLLFFLFNMFKRYSNIYKEMECKIFLNIEEDIDRYKFCSQNKKTIFNIKHIFQYINNFKCDKKYTKLLNTFKHNLKYIIKSKINDGKKGSPRCCSNMNDGDNKNYNYSNNNYSNNNSRDVNNNNLGNYDGNKFFGNGNDGMDAGGTGGGGDDNSNSNNHNNGNNYYDSDEEDEKRKNGNKNNLEDKLKNGNGYNNDMNNGNYNNMDDNINKNNDMFVNNFSNMDNKIEGGFNRNPSASLSDKGGMVPEGVTDMNNQNLSHINYKNAKNMMNAPGMIPHGGPNAEMNNRIGNPSLNQMMNLNNNSNPYIPTDSLMHDMKQSSQLLKQKQNLYNPGTQNMADNKNDTNKLNNATQANRNNSNNIVPPNFMQNPLHQQFQMQQQLNLQQLLHEQNMHQYNMMQGNQGKFPNQPQLQKQGTNAPLLNISQMVPMNPNDQRNVMVSQKIPRSSISSGNPAESANNSQRNSTAGVNSSLIPNQANLPNPATMKFPYKGNNPPQNINNSNITGNNMPQQAMGPHHLQQVQQQPPMQHMQQPQRNSLSTNPANKSNMQHNLMQMHPQNPQYMMQGKNPNPQQLMQQSQPNMQKVQHQLFQYAQGVQQQMIPPQKNMNPASMNPQMNRQQNHMPGMGGSGGSATHGPLNQQNAPQFMHNNNPVHAYQPHNAPFLQRTPGQPVSHQQIPFEWMHNPYLQQQYLLQQCHLTPQQLYIQQQQQKQHNLLQQKQQTMIQHQQQGIPSILINQQKQGGMQMHPNNPQQQQMQLLAIQHMNFPFKENMPVNFHQQMYKDNIIGINTNFDSMQNLNEMQRMNNEWVKGRILSVSNNNNNASIEGVPEDDIFDSNYHCDICNKDITHTIRIRCADCVDFDLCINCFSSGKEIKSEKCEHYNYHNYIPIPKYDFPLYKLNWSAEEELLLLDGISKYGFGNWEQVADLVNSVAKIPKTNKECESHYYNYYLKSSCAPLPDNKRLLIKPDGNPYDIEHVIEKDINENEDYVQTKNKKNTRTQIIGYWPLRGDFDIEYDNDAELLLADMEFKESDLPQQKELKLQVLEIYNSKLDERIYRKRTVIERGLLDTKSQLQKDKKRTKEEKELYTALKPLSRFLSPQHHEYFIQLLLEEQKLRQRLTKLQEWKTLGLQNIEQVQEYEVEKNRRAKESIKQQQENTENKVTKSFKSSKHEYKIKSEELEDNNDKKLNIETFLALDLLNEKEVEFCKDMKLPILFFLLIKRLLIMEVSNTNISMLKDINELKLKGYKVGQLYDFFLSFDLNQKDENMISDIAGADDNYDDKYSHFKKGEEKKKRGRPHIDFSSIDGMEKNEMNDHNIGAGTNNQSGNYNNANGYNNKISNAKNSTLINSIGGDNSQNLEANKSSEKNDDATLNDKNNLNNENGNDLYLSEKNNSTLNDMNEEVEGIGKRGRDKKNKKDEKKNSQLFDTSKNSDVFSGLEQQSSNTQENLSEKKKKSPKKRNSINETEKVENIKNSNDTEKGNSMNYNSDNDYDDEDDKKNNNKGKKKTNLKKKSSEIFNDTTSNANKNMQSKKRGNDNSLVNEKEGSACSTSLSNTNNSESLLSKGEKKGSTKNDESTNIANVEINVKRKGSNTRLKKGSIDYELNGKDSKNSRHIDIENEETVAEDIFESTIDADDKVKKDKKLASNNTIASTSSTLSKNDKQKKNLKSKNDHNASTDIMSSSSIESTKDRDKKTKNNDDSSKKKTNKKRTLSSLIFSAKKAMKL